MEKLELMQDVSLTELAAIANLSPFYFARAFKQTTGLPPHHFQQRVRIERAKDLLTSTQLSVTDIALRVGYGSSQALARVFRGNVGTTPVEYRRCSAP
jgi:AraC family transcriptional regulator